MADVVTGGLHRVETVMGIPVGIDVRDDGVDPAALDRAFERLRAADARFSPYRPDSDVRRIAAGTLAVAEAAADVRRVLVRCERLRAATGGRFDVHATGRLDPSAFVKGWAVDEAVAVLRAAGARNLCVHAGGDVRVCGERRPGDPWRIGVQHPRERDRVAAVLHAPAAGLAVATSGTYERGAHIIDPRTGRPPRGVLSVTVAGPELATADAYATAAFAMGTDGPAWTTTLDGHAAMTILADGRVLSTPCDGRPAGRVTGDRDDRRDAHGPAGLAARAPRAMRGVDADTLPPALLDVRIQRVRVPGGDVFMVRPEDWEQLRHEEGGAGRGVPYWATPWPSGAVLAGALAEDPPPPGARVLELGCGLALPSIVAARAGADVLATDGSSDAVVFAAHSLALNDLVGEVAEVDWSDQADALAARGPWDVVLAADILYLRANVEAALALLPRLVGPGGEIRLADPRRAGARDFLAAARATFSVRTRQDGEIALHRLTPRVRPRRGVSPGGPPTPGR